MSENNNMVMRDIVKTLKIDPSSEIEMDFETFKTFTGVAVHENGYGFFKDGCLHCEDGPALVRKDGEHEYFLDGEHQPKGSLGYKQILCAQMAKESDTGLGVYIDPTDPEDVEKGIPYSKEALNEALAKVSR